MDPYKVLGVREDASDEEIKAAYRQLVKKYHPDQYGDNPLADLAQEKLKEINEAYAQIESLRKNNKNNSYYQQSGAYQSGNAAYAAIRAMINAGRLQEAEERLAGMTAHDAEWFFLRGVIYRRKGWHTEAADCFNRAAAMDPGNEEYCRAQADTAQRAAFYSNSSRARGGSGCDLCLGLCVADSCCECMGGDLIPCC